MAETEKLRVVLTGGGSGGHIYPLLAVAESLHAQLDNLKAPYELLYIGPKDTYSDLLKGHGIPTRSIMGGKIRRYLSLDNIIDIPKFFIGFIQALFALYRTMPDIVFSKGGTGAFAVVLAAWFYRIPVAIHESDAQPGLTNLASARFASKIFVSFAAAAKYFDPRKTIITGAPLRKELLGTRTTKELAKESLGFDRAKLLTLIIGGSQGSKRINEFILENLDQIVAMTQVFHQTGVANFAEVQRLSHAVMIQESAANRYLPVDYLTDTIAVALTAADLVIARSGSSVFEFASFGLPAILIPIAESANGHQLADAYEFASTGAAVVIEESNLLPGIFFGEFKKILEDSALREKMSAASAAFFTPGAADKIAEEIINLTIN